MSSARSGELAAALEWARRMLDLTPADPGVRRVVEELERMLAEQGGA